MGARTLGEGLYAAGLDVTLFGGGEDLTVACPYVSIRNIPRETPLVRSMLSWHRRYLLEQYSFEAFLLRRLRRDHYDIVHVADPALALRLERRAGAFGTRVLYQDSQLLGATWCGKFQFVQVLAPYYEAAARQVGIATQNWAVVPYSVDTARYTPPPDRAEQRRRLLGGRVSSDEFVLLVVGDFSPESKKRLEWIVQEVEKVDKPGPAVHLVGVGQASDKDFAIFKGWAESRLGDRVHLFANMAPERMNEWFQLADAFAHAALREPFGIVFLEALASGLPVLAHPFEVTKWIVGDGGLLVDMTESGELAAAIEELRRNPPLRNRLSLAARLRAQDAFAADVVIPLYVQAYERMLGR